MMMKRPELKVDLTPLERKMAHERLGREPNSVELGMIDVMWSEHCSYKSSRPILKLLPKSGTQVVVGPGYDAGVVDIGGGYVVAFKLESHNHPSAIEPYNGAATGVGGIVRDILSMCCRPIALLDSLRFGPLSSGHSKWLFQNVVQGIADYGNRIGVPTVGGEVEFDDSFEANCLVNVACVGVGRREDLVLPKLDAEGDIVALVGGSTGRDGIHGVTFASRTISEESESDRPAVQVADAFTEKLVIEAVLESLGTGFVRGVKDLGGGGLTCASSEMSYKGGRGLQMDLDKIHMREHGMVPVEILLSESQERMLMGLDPRGTEKIRRIFSKYEVPFSVIGKVTGGGLLQAFTGGQSVVKLPAEILADAPIIPRIAHEPAYVRELSQLQLPAEYPNPEEALARVVGCPNVSSKEYVYRQYDHEVGIRTVIKPGDGDAAVLRIIEADRAIAVSSDCNSRHCYFDPFNGTAGAVAQGVQNVVAVGGSPLAVADGCNFGSPEKPEVFWQFTRALEGLRYMLSGLDLPCVGGNVSFYNEDEQTGRTVKPTTVVVTLGVIKQLEWITSLRFKAENEALVAVGITRPELGGSEYCSQVLETDAGEPPKADAKSIRSSIRTVESAIREGLVTAAHDCSKGGLAAAVALMSLKGRIGADIDLTKVPCERIGRLDELLFSESYGRFLLTATQKDAERIVHIARKDQAAASIIGVTGGKSVILKEDGRKIVDYRTSELEEVWRECIPISMSA